MRRLFLTLLGLAGVFLASSAFAQEMSSAQLRGLNARAAEKHARRDLEAVLLPPGRYPVGNRIEVGSVWFPTLPFASTIKGICSTDTLLLRYAPTKPGPASASRALRAYGVDTVHAFGFVRKPEPSMLGKDGKRAEGVPAEDCDSLSKDSILWIAGNDPEELVKGWLAFDTAVSRLAAGTLNPTRCGAFVPPGQPQPDCKAALMGMHDYRKLAGLDRCDGADGNLCYRLDVDSAWIYVELRKESDPAHLQPDDVTSISIDWYITVT